MRCAWRPRGQALTAQEELADCARLARQLALLKTGMSNPQTLDTHVPDIARSLRDAASLAALPDAINTIQLGQASRTSDPAILEIPLNLHGLSLQQLATFVYSLSSDASAVQVTSLGITRSQGGGPAGFDAEITVACTVDGNLRLEGR